MERFKKVIKNIDKMKSTEVIETLLGKDYKKRVEMKYNNKEKTALK